MSEITAPQVEALVSAVRSGVDLDTACHFAGVSNALVLRYLERGKLEAERIVNGDKPNPVEAKYLKLWDDLKKSRADAVVRNVAHVQKAAQEDWRAASWWLERTVPEHYGKRAERSNAIESSSPKELPEAREA